MNMNAPEKRDGMVRKLVARRLTESHIGLGWQLVKGKTPDGVAWQGDAVWMEISEEKYKQLRADHRLPFDTVRSRRESGDLPFAPETVDGITVKTMTVQGQASTVGADGSTK